MNMEEKVYQIPVELIIPNRFQPRLNFDDGALNELAESIKQHGIIQPLVLRKIGDKYEIIAGERRYKAAIIAGLKTVPAVLSDLNDQKTAEVALVENIQRKNLTSIEEARSYKNILEQGGMTQEQLADKLGVSQATVANKLRLLNLSEEVQDALLNEKISERHARALLAVKDKTEQIKWLNKIINDRLTVRQLDIELKKALKDTDDDDSIPIVELTPNVDSIKENALDINPTQGLHDIESMLKPSTPGEKTYDLSNPVDNVETLDLDGGEEKVNEEVQKPQNKFFNFLEDEVANMNDNNSIDDMMVQNTTVEQPVTVDGQPQIDLMPNQQPIINEQPPMTQPIDNMQSVDNNQVVQNEQPNIMDQNIINPINTQTQQPIMQPTETVINDPLSNSVMTPIQEQPINNIDINKEPVNNTFLTQEQMEQNMSNDNLSPLDNSINNVSNINLNDTIDPMNVSTPDNTMNSDTIIQNNPSNTFFNFSTTPQNNINSVDNNIIEPAIEQSQVTQTTDNNTINVIEPIVEQKVEPIFDPMSMVNTLEPGYQEQVAVVEGTSITNAINDIRSVRDNLEQRGFNITMEEADLGDSYNIIINIIK